MGRTLSSQKSLLYSFLTKLVRPRYATRLLLFSTFVTLESVPQPGRQRRPGATGLTLDSVDRGSTT